VNVLGLDLSLTSTGVAHCDGSADTWQVKLLGADRLISLRDRLVSLLDARVDLAVIEGYAFGRPNQASHIGELGGVVRVTLREHNVPFVAVPPSSVKRYATGQGNASKEQMLVAAVKRLGYEGASNDEADALWLRAMALDHYGEPVTTVPVEHRAGLSKIEWPDLVTT
jgi:crossover junction endodeoxyribonuclease RuvC